MATPRRISRRIASTSVLAAAFLTITASGMPASAATGQDLVRNGSFAEGLTGWSPGNEHSALTLSTAGVDETPAAKVTALRSGLVGVTDATSTVSGTVAGRSYTASAAVASDQVGASTEIRVNEIHDGRIVRTSTVTAEASDRRWQRLTVPVTATRTGAELDVVVNAAYLAQGRHLLVDDVSVRSAARPGPEASPPVAPTGSETSGSTAPVQVSASSSSTDTATISWTLGSDVDSVSAVYVGRDGVSAGGYRDWESGALSASDGSLTFKNLTPGTSYTVYAQLEVDGERGSMAAVSVTTQGASVVAPEAPAPTPAPAPSPSAPSTGSAGTLTNGCTYSARGIPDCGAFLGAAYGGNADPTSWEASMGDQLGVHRTYFDADGVDSAVRTAAADLAKGRMPWISFKLPHGWTDMANGKGDAWASDIAAKLSRLDGPVWVAFHHEPEGDGSISEWTRMQAHLAPLVRGKASNVAYTIVLTGWNQLYGPTEYHLDALWPKSTEIDLVGFDIYNQHGVVKDGRETTSPTDMVGKYFAPLSAWAEAHDVAWGLGETGFTDRAASEDPQWIARTYGQLQQYGGVAFAYFNTNLNSIADWALTSTSEQATFTAPLRTSSKLR